MKPLHVIKGKVLEGKKRGRTLGYPTVNIATTEQIPQGVYTSTVEINGQTYHAATFVGVAKTFGETAFVVESYILDFSDMIYGNEVTVTLYKKLRENKKFDSAASLITQMEIDVVETRKFFTPSDS
jgi:riboflavin kinase / FMN adenylyltransferase